MEAAGARTLPRYKPRHCEECGGKFTPGSGRQRWCGSCAPAARKNAQQAAGASCRARRRAGEVRVHRRRPEFQPRTCEGCGRQYRPSGTRQRYCQACAGADGDKRAKNSASARRLRIERGSSPRPGRAAYKPRACPGCARQFTPRSGSQQRCDDCATPASRKARARYVDSRRRARQAARQAAGDDRARRIRELAAAGMPQRQIAAEVGCSRTTVRMVLIPAERERHRAEKRAWRTANPGARRQADRDWRQRNGEAIRARYLLRPAPAKRRDTAPS